MASETPESELQNTQDIESRPRGGRGGRGGGGRGRGSGRGGGDGWRGGRGGRGRGAGRGGGHAQQPTALTSQTLQNPIQTPNTSAQIGGDGADGDIDDSVCFICANPVLYHSIAPCGHSTCHICSLRMRTLYMNKACAHCRTESDYVVFAPDDNKKYEEYDDDSIVRIDADLGIKYATTAIHDDTVLLLRYNCPEPNCDVACLGWKGLHSHVKSAHDRVMCRLCTHNKKVFTHEHALFTFQQLKKHERDGDDLPGSSEQSGFKGHPECGFCRTRFYSSDELYKHCRETHERCFICDRQNYSQNQQYYLDYDALVVHFQKEHFMCPEQDCLETKFIVFASEVDLKAHQLEVHPHGLSKAAKRDARRIDISQFETSRAPQLGRGRGRGRDPNAEPPPPRAEQPLRRDELAYQRTLAVQSSQSTTSRTFGGQLTQTNGPPAAQASRPVPVQTTPVPAARAPVAASAFPPLGSTQPPPPATVPPPVRPPTSIATSTVFPPLGAAQFPPLSGTPPPPPQTRASPHSTPPSQTPQPKLPGDIDDGKRNRHAAVIERASTLVKHDPKKLETFRRYVSDYKTGILTPREICDSFWNLFDTNANDLGILIRSLAELYDDDNKRTALLTAWNSWKAVNEDYPPFAGTGATSSASGGARVLKIKSSTTPSARSARQGAWGTAASPLPGPAPTSTSRGVGSSVSPWVSPNTAASRQPTRSVVTTPISASYATIPGSNTHRAPSAAEFPSLPAKPPMHTFGPVIRNNASGGRGTVVNAWTTSQNDDAAATVAADSAPEPEESGGKKKKGKQKQTLFHFG